MGKQTVPVSLGSTRFRTVEVGGLRVTDAWFPPRQHIPIHHHDRPCVATVVRGSFDVRFPGHSRDCPTTTLWTEPAGERHGNRAHDVGARVLVIQPEHSLCERFAPLASLLDDIHHFQHGGIAEVARRTLRELRQHDSIATLAVESLALDILVAARRTGDVTRESTSAPRWLLRAQEYVHEHFREPMALGHLARTVGVHPAHLSRVFRARFRVSIADYVRGLRLEWATRRLGAGETPIGEIAVDAGFADQSHFSRAFKRYMGVTPGNYRTETRTRRACR